MDYTVTFDQFAIETSTKLTSFYDFIVQVEQGYSDGTAIDFLLVNYDQIVKILPIYEKEEAFFEDFATSLELVMLVGYLFISFLTLLLAASFIIILKMVKTHEKIYSLYQFIDRGDAKKIIK